MYTIPSVTIYYSIIACRRHPAAATLTRHPTGGVALFRRNDSDWLGSSRGELPDSNDSVSRAMILGLVNRNVGRVA